MPAIAKVTKEMIIDAAFAKSPEFIFPSFNLCKILLRFSSANAASISFTANIPPPISTNPPQALSYHLSKLKKANLIYETKYKNYIYYELNLSVLDETIMY